MGIGMAFKKSLKDVPPEEIVRMVESGDQEPVAHQLLREAWELRSSNPRSALAIGIAAAEIGVKDLIASLVPNAQWLVMEMPSPPVVKILREYLPMLPVRGRFKDKTPQKLSVFGYSRGQKRSTRSNCRARNDSLGHNRRPLPRPSHPFTGRISKGRSGWNLPVRGTVPQRPLLAHNGPFTPRAQAPARGGGAGPSAG